MYVRWKLLEKTSFVTYFTNENRPRKAFVALSEIMFHIIRFVTALNGNRENKNHTAIWKLKSPKRYTIERDCVFSSTLSLIASTRSKSTYALRAYAIPKIRPFVPYSHQFIHDKLIFIFVPLKCSNFRDRESSLCFYWSRSYCAFV